MKFQKILKILLIIGGVFFLAEFITRLFGFSLIVFNIPPYPEFNQIPYTSILRRGTFGIATLSLLLPFISDSYYKLAKKIFIILMLVILLLLVGSRIILLTGWSYNSLPIFSFDHNFRAYTLISLIIWYIITWIVGISWIRNKNNI